MTRSPRPSSAIFSTGSDEMLVVGMAWERGYVSNPDWKPVYVNVSGCGLTRIKSGLVSKEECVNSF